MPIARMIRSAREDALSDEEILQLLNACRGIKDQFVVSVPLYCGLRVSELAHMNASWLDWREGTISIPPTQWCHCRECRLFRNGVWGPKTPASVRSVIIPAEARPVMERLFSRGRAQVGVGRRAIEARVSRIAKRSGIEHPVYPHALRATAATLFANRGMSVPTVRYLMGWERLATAELYVQSTKRRALEEARAKMG